MPYVLTIVGIMLIVSGIRNTHAQLGAQLKSDFTGAGNFTYWIIAIGMVGMAGYVKVLQTPSRIFMAIILLGIFLSKGNQGFFPQFTAAIKAGPENITPAADAPASSASTATNSNGTGPFGVGTMNLKDSLTKKGGGGFWDYTGIPSPF